MIIKILLVILITMGVGVLTYLQSWPWWIGVSILGVLGGVYTIFYFLRKYLIQRKQKSFIDKMAQTKQNPAIQEIQREWQNYENILQNSGKSIYDLPWFMVLGQSRSGKTSLIKYSNLSLPITPISRNPKVYSTKHCDWWFFEEGIILDMAGRYSVSEDISIDEKEWNEILELLSKTRQKEPLNGIVCVVSADKFEDEEKLKIEAENIKARIDNVMKILGVQFPIFIMVTKMDLVEGFVPFFENYKLHFGEVMGYINEDNLSYQEAMDNTKDILKTRVYNLYQNINKPTFKDSNFVSEFDKVLEKLDHFVELIFSENSFLTSPMFKGVYFSSALQTDIVEKQKTHKPMFIKDFFKEILPSQRGFYTILKNYISKRFKSQKILFLSQIALILSISSIGFFASYQEYKLLHSISLTKPEKAKNLNENVINLKTFETQIDEFKFQKSNLFLDIYPFSNKTEKLLKQNYVEFFETKLFPQIKGKLSQNIASINKLNDYKLTDYYVGFLVDTILALQDKLNNDEVKFSKYFPIFTKNFIIIQTNLSTQIARILADEYLTYLKYNNNYVTLKNQLKFFQDQLEDIIANYPALKFLTDKSVSLLEPITIGEFWGIKYDKYSIQGAFTKKGKENIQISIDQLEKVLRDKKKFQKNVDNFNQYYKMEFFKEWYGIYSHFDIKKLIIKNDALTALSILSMTSQKNPYFEFLHKSATEVRNYKSIYDWNKLLIQFDDIKTLANTLNKANSSIVDKLKLEKQKIKTKALSKKTSDIKMAVLYNKYVKNLENFTQIASPKQSYILVKNLYATTDTPSKLSQLHYSFLRFKEIMPKYKYDTFNVFKLIEGPKNFIFYVTFYKTSQIINKLWNQKVLSNLTTYSINELFEKNGYVRNFLNQYIGIFLVKTPFGYKSKEMFGYKIDFSKQFLEFLNQLEKKYGAKKLVYNLKFTTFPIKINKNVILKPFKTKLVLECPNKSYSLENLNYKNSEIFKWDETCKTTTIYIYFKDKIISKKYDTFIDFINSLKDNTIILTPKDFSDSSLKGFNFKYIQLKYGIDYDGFLDEYSKKIKVPYMITNTK